MLKVKPNKKLSIKERYRALKKKEEPELFEPKYSYPRNIFKKSAEKLPTQIIKYALKNERTARAMERDNTLVFIVDVNSTKPQIRKAVMEMYGKKVKKVNTSILFKKYAKKAFVRFVEEGDAITIGETADIL